MMKKMRVFRQKHGAMAHRCHFEITQKARIQLLPEFLLPVVGTLPSIKFCSLGTLLFSALPLLELLRCSHEVFYLSHIALFIQVSFCAVYCKNNDLLSLL